MTTTTATDEQLVAAADAAVAQLTQAVRRGGSRRSRDEWLGLVGSCQRLVNSLTAVQDEAIAEVARREPVWAEDGTVGEVTHAPGRVALDAADLVAPALGASHAQAQRRVETAVRVGAARRPVEADDRDAPAPSGLGALHAAMAEGRLDPARCAVVAAELELAPADVAEAVVAALDSYLDTDDGPSLRRRARRVLARISPDLLRQRAARARAETGLRRWVSEPGVDTWHGTFPSEAAAAAWAAIDRLAHQHVAAGVCTSVEQARGKALTDLVLSSATVDVRVVLAVPADASAPVGAPAAEAPAAEAAAGDDRRCGSPDDLVQVQGGRPSEPLFVARSWLARHTDPVAAPVACSPRTGARLDASDALTTGAYRPGDALAALVRARDGRCRFPGCSVAARFCDLDHVRPWPAGPTAAANLVTLCRRHHRIKQAPGWRLRLHPDATATWADPDGRVRTTAPLDALEVVVLASGGAPPPASPDPPDPAPVWSALESRLALALDHHDARRARHRRCTSAARLRQYAQARRRARAPGDDTPPF
ncbi:HNH endonuclease signature motif containing protein [uncultured Phycicoccus sp.]|uniref:HNH endonuclease signature motif containing protein n=1 Tax=uncultured Phycicoccus sp. TaxID=661422 RepID=UPI00261837E3|nr:HNH endonuclease signature motif containing protein [uncultured Phycicoccus sp.]